MKKYLFFVLCTFFSFPLFSQGLASVESVEKEENEKIQPSEENEKKFILNIFYSPILNSSLSHADENKFENSYGLDVLFETKHTYHYIGYDLKNKAFNTTFGYPFTDNYSVYSFFSHQIKSDFDEELKIKLPKENILSLGFEYFIEKKYIETIIFYEFGTSFSKEEKIFRNNFFSFGLIFEGHTFKF